MRGFEAIEKFHKWLSRDGNFEDCLDEFRNILLFQFGKQGAHCHVTYDLFSACESVPWIEYLFVEDIRLLSLVVQFFI